MAVPLSNILEKISIFYHLRQFTLKLNYVSLLAFQKMFNNSNRTVINLLVFDFAFIVYHGIVKLEERSKIIKSNH